MVKQLTNNDAMKYLDPKADLPFRAAFRKYPDLAISLLNALLPLTPTQKIIEIEYLPIEFDPKNPLKKDGILEIKCKDEQEKEFIVSVQTIWSRGFTYRINFDYPKAYIQFYKCEGDYHLPYPTYSLNLVNEIFEPGMKEYYHHYKLVHDKDSNKVIDGLQLVFVELPKFTPHTYAEKKMQVLWLRFLTEINEHTVTVPKDLLANPEVNKAVKAIEEAAFSPAQLLGYEKFWDIISTEKTLFYSAEQRGLASGMEKGMKEGMEKGKEEEKRTIARNMKSFGMPPESIAQITGLSVEEIKAL